MENHWQPDGTMQTLASLKAAAWRTSLHAAAAKRFSRVEPLQDRLQLVAHNRRQTDQPTSSSLRITSPPGRGGALVSGLGASAAELTKCPASDRTVS